MTSFRHPICLIHPQFFSPTRQMSFRDSTIYLLRYQGALNMNQTSVSIEIGVRPTGRIGVRPGARIGVRPGARIGVRPGSLAR